MKSIVISSNRSGGGKTTVTLGIMKALKNRGFDVQGYKIGPDYIDPAFHTKITGKSSRNLDLFLMGEEGVKASFSRGQGDVGIVEGVMGLYDGKGIDSMYSTAHAAKVLDLPVILVLSPKAQAATLCAEINGLLNFDKVNIKGVVFNNISQSYYKLLKLAVEKNCNIKVYGYVPKDEKLSLKSRHLGLVQSSEVDDLLDKIEYCSELIEKFVDVDELIEDFKEVEKYEDKFHLENKNLRTAVAYDKAFSFYYKENLELLEEVGEVVYFSPIKDKYLPENIDFLYLGGGYPEVFAEELSQNKSMRQSIKEALDNGLTCYAECGGLLYLVENLNFSDDSFESNLFSDKFKVDQSNNVKKYDMVGFFRGSGSMTKKLQHFGYAQVEIEKDNLMLTKGTKISCHEFHRSKVESTENKIYRLTKKRFDGDIKQWNCGYHKNNVTAGYAHVHFFGNLQFLKELVSVKK